MTYADAYRLAWLLDEQMQQLLDGAVVDQNALAEAHGISVRLCASMAKAWVAGQEWVPDGEGSGSMQATAARAALFQVAQRALDECGGVAARAARKCGVHESTLWRWREAGHIHY